MLTIYNDIKEIRENFENQAMYGLLVGKICAELRWPFEGPYEVVPYSYKLKYIEGEARRGIFHRDLYKFYKH